MGSRPKTAGENVSAHSVAVETLAACRDYSEYCWKRYDKAVDRLYVVSYTKPSRIEEAEEAVTLAKDRLQAALKAEERANQSRWL